MEDQLSEFFMYAEGGRDEVADAGVRGCGFLYHSWNVAGGMFSRREHVGEYGDVVGAGRNAVCETGGDGWFGELHVGVSDNDFRSGHGLYEVRHADEHVVRLAQARAVIDYENCFHVALKMNGRPQGGK